MTVVDREALRDDLRALGFDEVRFVAADKHPRGDFTDWLAAGHHADMDWLARSPEKRLDPANVLPGVRTIILLGVNYLPDGDAASQSRWAKYALHADYHDTILTGLRNAGRLLESAGGLAREDYRAYVDTGPLLERGWAAAAGIGWQGKNAMLISKQHGNWLFLSAILVRLEIPPDPTIYRDDETQTPPIGHHCGTCTRCLTACPTDAFPRPGWVDARRCIAYHTIENRGIIPRELRSKFGGRIFGCDTCLDVCPWNRFAQAGRSMLLAARTDLAGLDLVELLTMNEEKFRETFRKTAIKRTKLTGLLRNACIAAGNWRDSDDWHFGASADVARVIEAVERLCRHESAIVRTHAVWAMFRLLGAEEASARLAETCAVETDSEVLAEYKG
jgi:epoxyqueuosine reductase